MKLNIIFVKKVCKDTSSTSAGCSELGLLPQF